MRGEVSIGAHFSPYFAVITVFVIDTELVMETLLRGEDSLSG